MSNAYETANKKADPEEVTGQQENPTCGEESRLQVVLEKGEAVIETPSDTSATSYPGAARCSHSWHAHELACPACCLPASLDIGGQYSRSEGCRSDEGRIKKPGFHRDTPPRQHEMRGETFRLSSVGHTLRTQEGQSNSSNRIQHQPTIAPQGEQTTEAACIPYASDAPLIVDFKPIRALLPVWVDSVTGEELTLSELRSALLDER